MATFKGKWLGKYSRPMEHLENGRNFLVHCDMTSHPSTLANNRACIGSTGFSPVYIYIWMFPKIGLPQNGWFILENPIKMG